MKKTIAKIMAAAMVLSTIAAPNVLAATAYDGTVVNDAANYKAAATFEIGGVKVFENGAATDNEFYWELTDAEYTSLASDYTTTVKLEQTLADSNKAKLTSYSTDAAQGFQAKAVTATTAKTDANAVYTNNLTAITKILTGKGDAKNLVARENVNDVVYAKNIPSNYFITNITAANTVQNIIDRTVTVGGENMHAYVLGKLASAGIVVVRSQLQIQGVDTGLVIWRALSWGGVANDDYWNAIVKLKASNNRYTPIRVHVDTVEGSLSGWNGLYVQVVNGSARYWYDINGRRVTATTTGNLSINSWNNNRLQIQDVQADDLALLRSDAAKGKNLMLDEAYLFNVADWANDNGLYSAQNMIIDWSILGVNTDLDTISIGKIQDIRSGLFKKCKEKLVHAKNVKWIRNGAFRENKQLKKAILSDDVSMKKINEKAFYKCKKLNTVKVKVNTLKHVGKNAFGDSTDKKSLKFNLKAGSKAKYNKAVKLFKKSGVKKAKFRKI